MSLERLPDNATTYHLVAFDADGAERSEDGRKYTTQLKAALAAHPTDVFVLSHGWQGDIPAARDQYTRWITAMLQRTDQIDRLSQRPRGFKPVLIGLHWPSKAWGDEELVPAAYAIEPSASDAPTVRDRSVADLTELFVGRLDSSQRVHSAVAAIVSETMTNAAPRRLPDHIRAAYQAIDAELSAHDEDPNEDRGPFDADEMYQACRRTQVASFGGTSLGGLLAPLRMMTFWHMKRRAKRFGETGAAAVLGLVRQAAPGSAVHVMGHSFGCIVASAALSTSARDDRDAVASLILLQGAMSLWSFCEEIPFAFNRSGAFRRIPANRLVSGTTLVTTSVHDRAVGTFYPIGAGARRQLEYAPGPERQLPKYGAIGAWGARGPGLQTVDTQIGEWPTAPHDLRGTWVNLDASAAIATGTGVSGAHNDICHEDLADLIWDVVDCGCGT
ncbi:hypothetical protein P3H15_42530 [Rhodococcus sp. T2V]|uniref:hypothetical protein n=1 Tax=Rhodococcus sp. T2V TaxID=3034164 RepID=UPI0023E09643|nr:hypothetical protein [Rhodococcus sp. T2V]MDF3311660.1 hypothetical protein [Rhodococcus sp. T2V]